LSYGLFYDWLGQPITLEQWTRLFEDERHIGYDQIGDVRISTVWLGLDHRLLGHGPPLIFETMIFGGDHDQDCWRYSSEYEARKGHDRALALVAGKVEP